MDKSLVRPCLMYLPDHARLKPPSINYHGQKKVSAPPLLQTRKACSMTKELELHRDAFYLLTSLCPESQLKP